MAGILILLGLVVLAIPLLLIVVLVKLGNARARIEDLERDVQGLHARVAMVEQPPAQARPASTIRTEAAAAPPAAAPARFEAPPIAQTPAQTPADTAVDTPVEMPPAAHRAPAAPPPLPERPAPRAPAP
ncbi:MAG: DUF2339 domain-containing protein, partial [Xanthomonadales bacterium]|nr:DUF2339 domain-containing protein [Xanthomonadales bacterium]